MKKLARIIITKCNEAMIPDEITYSEANEFVVISKENRELLAEIKNMRKQASDIRKNLKAAVNTEDKAKITASIKELLKTAKELRAKIRRMDEQAFMKDDVASFTFAIAVLIFSPLIGSLQPLASVGISISILVPMIKSMIDMEKTGETVTKAKFIALLDKIISGLEKAL